MRVTIQDATTADILGQTVGTEIAGFGPDGRLLGRFTPAPRPGVSAPEFGISDEELERLRTNPNAKWHTGDEVTARLRAIDEGR